ncbi:MAG: TSUP family transporter, partial [Pseudomonadota bacterium]
FTSTVLHVGSPPFQIYLLPQKLPRDVFIGTTVTFFFLMNWMKLPVFIALGQLTGPNLLIALLVAPFALSMTFVGKRLASVIEPERFYLIIYLLLATLGLKLLWDGLSSLALLAG